MNQNSSIPNPERLVDGPGLLVALFEPDSRPSLRWLEREVEKKNIPVYRLGRLVRFDPSLVRQALERNFLVKARTVSAGGAK